MKSPFHFPSGLFFGTRTSEMSGIVVSPTAPRLAFAKTSPSAPQRYPGSCRNRAIPAQMEISVRTRANGTKRTCAQNHTTSTGMDWCFRAENEFTVESVAKIQ